MSSMQSYYYTPPDPYGAQQPYDIASTLMLTRPGLFVRDPVGHLIQQIVANLSQSVAEQGAYDASMLQNQTIQEILNEIKALGDAYYGQQQAATDAYINRTAQIVGGPGAPAGPAGPATPATFLPQPAPGGAGAGAQGGYQLARTGDQPPPFPTWFLSDAEKEYWNKKRSKMTDRQWNAALWENKGYRVPGAISKYEYEDLPEDKKKEADTWVKHWDWDTNAPKPGSTALNKWLTRLTDEGQLIPPVQAPAPPQVGAPQGQEGQQGQQGQEGQQTGAPAQGGGEESPGEQLVKDVQGWLDSYFGRATAAMGEAEDVVGQYKQLYDDVMKRLEGYGEQVKEDVRESFRRAGAAGQQQLTSRGLANTTLLPTLQQGLAREESDALARAQQGITDTTLAWQTQLADAANRAAQWALGQKGIYSADYLNALTNQVNQAFNLQGAVGLGQLNWDAAALGNLANYIQGIGIGYPDPSLFYQTSYGLGGATGAEGLMHQAQSQTPWAGPLGGAAGTAAGFGLGLLLTPTGAGPLTALAYPAVGAAVGGGIGSGLGYAAGG